MKKTLACSLTAFILRGAVAGTPSELQPANTYAVIAGVLNWPDKSLSGFSKENRRDQGLYDTLRARGVPEANMRLLLDEKATEANMRKALEDIAGLATKNATLIFYYAGHGYTGSEGVYFGCYDAGIAGGPEEGFLLRNISTILNSRYKGKQVLLLADCCYSGGLGDEAEILAKNGFGAASLTAASIDNASTDQWTFTCSIIDALTGRALLDRDGDGYVSILEAAAEVKDAMNFVEGQNHGFALHGMPESFRLAPAEAAQSAALSIPAPYALGQYVKVKDEGKGKGKGKGKGRGQTARIIGFQDGRLQLEIQRYSDRKVVGAAPGEIATIKRPDLPVVTATTLRPPVALDVKEAEKKAAMEGKYYDLLEKVPAAFDYLAYGDFSDYGRSEEEEYLGRTGLPAGYWVYVYPNWYIFEHCRDAAQKTKTNRASKTQPAI